MSADLERALAGGLLGYDLSAPPTWGAVPLEPARGRGAKGVRRALSDVAADLTTSAEGASHCEQQLLLGHDALVEEPHLGVAVWVPDPITGVLAAVLTVDHLVHDEDDGVARPDLYEYALRAGADQRSDLVRFDVARVRLPAGDAVLVRAVGAGPDGGLAESVTYTVFPDACRDAVQLGFTTPDLHLGEELATEAQAIADSLSVTGTSR